MQEVAGQTIVIPVGEQASLNAMITLNGTGRFLWQQLEKENTTEMLVAALLKEYDVDKDIAAREVVNFVEKLRFYGFLDECKD